MILSKVGAATLVCGEGGRGEGGKTGFSADLEADNIHFRFSVFSIDGERTLAVTNKKLSSCLEYCDLCLVHDCEE